MSRKPRTLIVTRLFSGLIGSVINKNWKPTGIPAIYKIIEGMNQSEIETDVLFLCKTEIESKHISKTDSFRLAHEKVNNIFFHIAPYHKTFINSTRFNWLYNDFYQLVYFIKLLFQRDYDLIYCDRANVFFGAVASVFTRKKVILRLLGIYPDMKELFINKKYAMLYPITYLSYLAPFTFITCTQDDSGGGYYLSRLPNKNVPKKLLLNGVDHKKSSPQILEQLREKHELKRNRPILLFVGKLEKVKGCIEYLETMINLRNQGCKFYALIIGSGSMSEKLEQVIEENNISDVVKFIGPVANTEICHYYNLTDIYVHLYVWASLTNTVLESMYAGNALVLISPSKEGHIGEYAEEIIPNDCALRFSRENIVSDLTEKLVDLLSNPEKISDYKSRMASLAPTILSGWKQRIDKEVDLIKKSLS